MFPHFEERRSDSPFVERIWMTQSERASSFTSISTVFWSMVISKWRGHITISLHGPETGATCKEFPAEGEWFGIAFKLGTFVPHISPGSLIDGNIVLPGTSGRSFSLCHSAWQFPNYENADTFVDQLVRAGILVHEPIMNAVPFTVDLFGGLGQCEGLLRHEGAHLVLERSSKSNAPATQRPFSNKACQSSIRSARQAIVTSLISPVR